MNTHKHARLTFARRLEMVKQMTLEGFDAVQAAALHGVTAPTARKWLGRYLAGGQAALADASSRPMRSPRTIDAGKALLIVELRKRRMLQARIARSVGVSESTVSRVLARAGMSKLSDLEPVEAVVRITDRGSHDLATHHAAQPQLAHQSLGRAAGDGHAFAYQLPPHLVGTVDLHVGLPDTLNLLRQHLVAMGSSTALVGLPQQRCMASIR